MTKSVAIAVGFRPLRPPCPGAPPAPLPPADRSAILSATSLRGIVPCGDDGEAERTPRQTRESPARSGGRVWDRRRLWGRLWGRVWAPAVVAASLVRAVATGLACAGLLHAPAFAAPPPSPPSGAVAIEAGTGRVLGLSGAAATVFAADPKVAEVRPASPRTLFVFGVAPGRTTVAAMAANGAPVGQFDVVVRPSSFAATEAGAAVRRALPGGAVAMQPTPNGLAVTGTVVSPDEAERAAAMARGYAGEKQTVTNRLQVQAPVQVNLRVRIAEMSRSLTRELGVNWQALGNLGRYGTFGFATANALTELSAFATRLGAGYTKSNATSKTDVNAVIDALSQDQLVRVLAEPNLTALSGESASFLVGGEFPIPVAQQNNTISVEFKQYGISLAFVPTVLGGDRISLHVRPEVSQLSEQGAVRISAGNSSIQIPALTVRRAETTVELGSGQSFAIAGLLQDNARLSGLGLPFLGDLPILGALFRSDSFRHDETELVILVTPYVVRPVSDQAALRRPDDGWSPPSDLERILLLRQTPLGQTPRGGTASSGIAPTMPTPAAARIPGDAGFVVR